MKKKVFYSEIAYIVGLLLIALSCALIKHTDFGVSMIVAPAYLLHLLISPVLPFFTFGTAEYCFQALLIIVMSVIVRRFRVSYLFSFVTAVLYGFILDGLIFLVDFIPNGEMWQRILLLIAGMQICAVGVAIMFRTYISPEAYELIVMEMSSVFHWNITKFKWIFDGICCALAIVMSFVFFGKWRFDVIGPATVVCAVLNGFFIGKYSEYLEKRFEFKDLLGFRKFFTGEEKRQ